MKNSIIHLKNIIFNELFNKLKLGLFFLSLVALVISLVCMFLILNIKKQINAINEKSDTLPKAATLFTPEHSNKLTINLQQQVKQAIETYEKNKTQQKINSRFNEYKKAVNYKIKIGNKKDWVYGSNSARFSLIEFSDLECPYCKKFHNIPKQIVDISKGAVNWKWRHLPLSFHNPAALKQALFTECIGYQEGNRAFWAATKAVFNLSAGNGVGLKNNQRLLKILGLKNNENFKSCLSDKRVLEKIQKNIGLAESLGINGTPALIVIDNFTNYQQILSGIQSQQAIIGILKKLDLQAKNKTNNINN